MLLQFLKESAYDQLIESVGTNIDWYNSPDSRIESLGIDEEWVGQSSIDVSDFSLAIPSRNASKEEKYQNDLINIRAVYSAWKKLSPLQARNKYMWTYYCHGKEAARNYIRERWMEGSFTEGQAKERFFVTGGRRNLTRGNALSSLWWMGYLTYDEGAIDEFWIAKTLGSITNMADFLDTFNSYDQRRTKGIARAIREVIDELNLDVLRNTHFRALNKYLNHYAAVTPLDFLAEDEIRDLAKEELIKICGAMGR